jgi:hypothetical protein
MRDGEARLDGVWGWGLDSSTTDLRKNANEPTNVWAALLLGIDRLEPGRAAGHTRAGSIKLFCEPTWQPLFTKLEHVVQIFFILSLFNYILRNNPVQNLF